MQLGLAIVEIPKSITDVISINGFLIDIGCLQCLHTPFNKNQLSKGIFSVQLKGCSQLSHLLLGETIDSPLGILIVIRLRKLPKETPTSRNIGRNRSKTLSKKYLLV